MPRINRKYDPEFKIKVIEDKINNKLGYIETAKKYELTTTVNGYIYPAKNRIQDWERIYLEEGKDGFYKEKRGRKSTGAKPKLSKHIQEDLIAENQRLRMELEYLKKLEALVQEREQREKKSRK